MTAKDAAEGQQTMAGLIGGFILSQAIHAVAKLGVVDGFDGEAQTPKAIAAKLGLHETALYRVMRCLASVGVFAEDSNGAFTLTPMGELLRSDHPQSLRAWAVMAGEPWVRAPWSDVIDTLKTNEPAFDRVMGKSAYEYLAANPAAAALFQAAMSQGSRMFTRAVLEAYDFSTINHIVDVGCGEGGFIVEILTAYPRMRATLFDLPHVEQAASSNLEQAGLSERCVVVSGSFFEHVPEGGDAYLLKWVLHNLDDAPCVKILQQCREAMSNDARLILVERILPAGNAPSDGKILDLNMMVLQGGRERTEAEFRALLETAGFELVRVTETASPLSVVEGRPVT